MAQVLIVDDDHQLRMSFERLLVAEGYDVRTASSGEAGIAAVREALPDVVVMDVRMPGMDGLETLRHMKEKAPKIPVILLTGHACMGVAVQGLDLGAYDYMLKPVAISELIIKMEEAARSAM